MNCQYLPGCDHPLLVSFWAEPSWWWAQWDTGPLTKNLAHAHLCGFVTLHRPRRTNSLKWMVLSSLTFSSMFLLLMASTCVRLYLWTLRFPYNSWQKLTLLGTSFCYVKLDVVVTWAWKFEVFSKRRELVPLLPFVFLKIFLLNYLRSLLNLVVFAF